MAHNVDSFRAFLKQKEIYMEEGLNEDNSVFFRTEQRLDNGGSVLLVTSFDTSEEIVEIYVFDIAEIKDAYKKESALKLINELNIGYRYSKFTLEDSGSISSSYSILFEDNFNPSVVLRQIFLAFNTAQEAYPKFMKIVWS